MRDFPDWGQYFELTRGGAVDNFRPMEGLRGFAVFLVFLVHYATLVSPWIGSNGNTFPLAIALHTVGNCGVDLFFVLSGYLIYGSLFARPQPFGAFMVRRVRRIYPAFLAVLLLYVALSFVFPSESKIPRSLIDGAAYLVANVLLLPGLLPVEPIITVAWSLSFEMFYYLMIPGVIDLFGLRARSRWWRVGFFVFCGLAGMVLLPALGDNHIRLVMFIAGILLYEAVHSDRIGAPGGTVGLVCLLLGLLSTLLPLGGYLGIATKNAALFAAFFMVCLSCYRSPKGWLSRLFCWTPLRWLGNMSYSYYLLHGLALKAGFMVFGKLVPPTSADSWLFWALLPPMFLMTLVPSAILFLVIERPWSLAPAPARHAVPPPKASFPE